MEGLVRPRAALYVVMKITYLLLLVLEPGRSKNKEHINNSACCVPLKDSCQTLHLPTYLVHFKNESCLKYGRLERQLECEP
jgi:hypothetical protein